MLEMGMRIPQPYLEMAMGCPECFDFKVNTPDMVAGHLVEMHNYNVGESDDAIQAWIDSFKKDENSQPIEECLDHGFYNAGSVCHGCEAYERRTNLKGE